MTNKTDFPLQNAEVLGYLSCANLITHYHTHYVNALCREGYKVTALKTISSAWLVKQMNSIGIYVQNFSAL